ncbi:YbfB/YjiJ family MFS transporter [Stappia stellulata]|uniref:YbfB/YjiJ family MFS transporter n=1 Tax=Stappia stellulata TaxID=71235 RepID=UPI001CD67036|nr:YbfB/YjiJ family MFS transporter [Stappia stellulata]MCA1244154.1 YbfB/YjiJ family MFS transporter [Stappia stellulata]
MESSQAVDRSSGDARIEFATAIALSTGAALALGLSRFSYALLLPPMQADLALSYVQAGALNTANGVGYIAGALSAPWAASRWGAKRTFLAAFLLSALALLATGVFAEFTMLFLVRTLGGVSTAHTFVIGAFLAAAISRSSDPRRRGTMVGIYVAGVGVGILLAGFAVPIAMNGVAARWPDGWIALGGLGLAGLPMAAWAVRGIREPAGGNSPLLGLPAFRRIAPTFFGYGLFGAGYVGYMTFIIALLGSQGISDTRMTSFWMVLGLVSAISTLVWGRVLGALRGGLGPTIVFATATVGTLAVLVSSGPVAMFVSAVIFGGSFLAGPTAITIVAQRQLPASDWTAAISLLTLSFALGQTVGPLIAGAVSDIAGDISAGFWVSPVFLGAAALVNALQKPSDDGTI